MEENLIIFIDELLTNVDSTSWSQEQIDGYRYALETVKSHIYETNEDIWLDQDFVN